jgi:hypothetical protein
LTDGSGRDIEPDRRLVVAMASNTVGRFAATALDGEPPVAAVELPVLVRDAVAGWLLAARGHIDADDFVAEPRWQMPSDCGVAAG